MFTGIIQKLGTVKRVSRSSGLVLEIESTAWMPPLEDGESIAVNGVCLTVARHDATRFTADVLRETEERTYFGELLPGAKVNLERALKAGDALGGHIVQGHVDGVGVIAGLSPRGRDFRLKVKCGRVMAAQSVLKGSIAIDGVSLTITEIGDDFLCVDLIPTTLSDTVLGSKRQGAKVNLESDILGKYIARNAPRQGLTEEALAKAGFI